MKMPKTKLNMNLVKIREEVNKLNELIWTKDPKRIYNLESGFEDNFNTMQIEQKTMTNLPVKNIIVRYPQLREDARVSIKRDTNLLLKAGGYNKENIYNDLSVYSKLGLI